MNPTFTYFITITVGTMLLINYADCGRKADAALDCKGKHYYNVSLTAYYPDYQGQKTDYLDLKLKKLRTLQDYLEKKVEFVTLSMDRTLGLSYGTKACIPELNHYFGRKLDLQIRDAGSNLYGKKYKRADICVRSEPDSYEKIVNGKVTLVICEADEKSSSEKK